MVITEENVNSLSPINLIRNKFEGSVGGIAHIVKTEAYTGIACGGSGSSLDGLNSNNSSRTGHVELDVDGYSPQSGPASSIPGGVGRLFGTGI